MNTRSPFDYTSEEFNEMSNDDQVVILFQQVDEIFRQEEEKKEKSTMSSLPTEEDIEKTLIERMKILPILRSKEDEQNDGRSSSYSKQV